MTMHRRLNKPISKSWRARALTSRQYTKWQLTQAQIVRMNMRFEGWNNKQNCEEVNAISAEETMMTAHLLILTMTTTRMTNIWTVAKNVSCIFFDILVSDLAFLFVVHSSTFILHPGEMTYSSELIKPQKAPISWLSLTSTFDVLLSFYIHFVCLLRVV